jgi:ankyrin repeat protein
MMMKIKNEYGWTAVMIASYYGYVEILKLLLAAGGKDIIHEKSDVSI